MEEKTISDISRFMYLVEASKANLFRGVQDKDYPLIPSIARNWEGNLEGLIRIENQMLDSLRLRAIPYLDYHPHNTWEWLILGQHYGMPTRLMDWTSNPLAALYFACIGDKNKDGVVYLSSGLPKVDTDMITNPFDIDSEYYISPPHLSTRIQAQSAFFTISPNPTIPLKTTIDVRIIVQLKRYLLRDLRHFGVGPAVYFPGLDGLCKEIGEEGLYEMEEIKVPIRLKRFGKGILRQGRK